MSKEIEVEGIKYKFLPDKENPIADQCVGCAFFSHGRCEIFVSSGQVGVCITKEGIWKEVDNEQA